MKELTLDATCENVRCVTDFVAKELKQLGCPTKAQMQIEMAIDELFSNISRYGYGEATGKATVRLEPCANPSGIILTFIDSAVPYNPLTTKEPDTSLSAEDRSIGGLGVFMVKKSMDDIQYEYKDGHNILRIRKNF